MTRMLRTILISALAALAFAGAAQAAGGHYVFDGGTPNQRKQVRLALNASAFDWNLVPGPITIYIEPDHDSEAAPGEIWLDANLLNAGVFSWGVVQHEYAHQVDFLLLNDEKRAVLEPKLGAVAWWDDGYGWLAHHDLGCERFASTLAWAYWPSPKNSMKPESKNDESAAMAPRALRGELAALIGAPDTVSR